MSLETELKASCLCGSVQIRIAGGNVTPAICHCTHCQKQTGSSFSTVLIVPITGLSVDGALSEYADTTDDGRAVSRRFCPNCGSPVQTSSAAAESAGVTIIKAGLLENGAPKPELEMFCDRVLDWVPVLTEGPRFPRMLQV